MDMYTALPVIYRRGCWFVCGNPHSGEKVNEDLQMFESICRGDYQSPGGTIYEFAAAFGEYETFYRAGGS